MDPLDAFDRLANLARGEPVPSMDVSARVLVAIRERQEASILPLWIYVGGLTPAAAAVAAFAFGAWGYLALQMAAASWTNPLVDLVTPLRLAIP